MDSNINETRPLCGVN